MGEVAGGSMNDRLLILEQLGDTLDHCRGKEGSDDAADR